MKYIMYKQDVLLAIHNFSWKASLMMPKLDPPENLY